MRDPLPPMPDAGPVFLWRDDGGVILVLPAPDHPGHLALLCTDPDGDVTSIDVPHGTMLALAAAVIGFGCAHTSTRLRRVCADCGVPR
jgi:hypothetical protein